MRCAYNKNGANAAKNGCASSPEFKKTSSIRFIAIAGAALALSACTVSNGIDTAGIDSSVKAASIQKDAALPNDGIVESDSQIIKSTVVNIDQQDDTSNLMSWHNPDTGNKGTITALEKVVNDGGKKCKKFQTTVDSFMGISLYNGKTCELRRGSWVLSWLEKHST